MKLSAALILATAASVVTAFTPAQLPKTTTTQLDVITNSDMFDINTGRTGMATPGMDYRPGGSLYFPQRTSTSYNTDTSYGGYGTKVEGGSRRTFDVAYSDGSMVELETDGRPLDAKVEIWEGPANTPAKMKLWSEDGAVRPWGPVGFGNFNAISTSTGSTMTVDNKGASEFPLYANVNSGIGRGMSSYMGTSRRQTLRIAGNGAQQSFNVGSGPIAIEIWSDGFPYFADVEVWDGPNNVKQSAEVYADSGIERPWSAIIEAPQQVRGSATIQVRNVGPQEYPIYVSIEQLGGGYNYY